MRIPLIALLVSNVVLVAACSGTSPEPGEQNDEGIEEVKGCARLKATSGARLMPADSSYATVGTFELLESEGARWRKIDSGPIVFQRAQDALDGEFLMATLVGEYESLRGGNRVTWRIAANGIVSNNDDAFHTSEVRWWLNNHVASVRTAVFPIASIAATTCSIRATSDVVSDDSGGEFRYQVRVKFAH